MTLLTNNRFHLDTPAPVCIGTDEHYLRGWLLSDSKTDAVNVSVIVDGLRYPAVGSLPRPDVARGLGRPDQEKCGFVVRFPLPRFDSSVRLVTTSNVGEVELATFRVGQGTYHQPMHRANTYQEWLALWEPTLFWPESEVSARLAVLAYQPLISVIVPTYNTNADFLRKCITSVKVQKYPHWQLCIADDCSSDKRVLTYLESVADEDSRVVFLRRSKRGNISAASNSALQGATGEFVVLLDHDDELHAFALLEIVRYLNQYPTADLIYSDEDKIDSFGIRSQPAFKPDFDLDLFLSFDYLGHLVALRRSVVDSVGGFRSECDGSQDWDLLVRVIERIGSNSVHHIQKPLYHWRMHEGSTASSLQAKPNVARAWFTVLSDHIRRTGQNADVRGGLFYGSMRIKRSANKCKVAVVLRAEYGAMQVSSILSARRQVTSCYMLVGCMLFRHALGVNRLADTEGEETSDLQAMAYHNFFQQRSICSMEDVPEDVFVFINFPLDRVNHVFFEELAAQADRDDVGLVTGISVAPDGRVLSAGLYMETDGEAVDPFSGAKLQDNGYMGLLSVVHEVDTIDGGFFAVRRDRLRDAGGIGSVSTSHMMRLIDRLGRQARASGSRILFTPYAVARAAVSPQIRGLPFDFEYQPYRRMVNRNLLAFSDLKAVMQTGI